MAAVETENITKEYLRKYRTLREEIETEQERLQMITEKMLGSSKGIGDGMPRGNVKESDILGINIIIKEDLEKRLRTLLSQEREMRNHIETELQSKLSDAQQKNVIRLHYINRLEWSEVRKAMFGKRKDYYEKEEKYKRLAFRIHGNALSMLNPETRGDSM